MHYGPELLTACELAKRLRVSPETVRAWSRRGVIPAVRLSRKVIRYNLRDVLASIESGNREGVAHA